MRYYSLIFKNQLTLPYELQKSTQSKRGMDLPFLYKVMKPLKDYILSSFALSSSNLYYEPPISEEEIESELNTLEEKNSMDEYVISFLQKN